jgi:hypothetical protein
MFDVIDFLESVGQDAYWRHADPEALDVALSATQIDPEVRSIILASDAQGLQALLGQATFCCLINPAMPGEEMEECDGSCKQGKNKEGDEKAS